MNFTLPTAVYATAPHPKVSEHYQFYSTLDITNALLDEGFEVYSARQGRSRMPDGGSYAKHELVFTHPRFRGTDELRPTFRVINSHNRSAALTLALGVVRFICSNGLIRGDIIGAYKFQHIVRNPVDLVMDGVQRLIREVAPTMDMISEMKTKQLSWDQQREFAVIAGQLRDITTFNPDLLETYRDEDIPNDVWTIYNRLQENLMRGNYTAGPKQRKARPIKAIQADFDLNTKLWNTALSYVS